MYYFLVFDSPMHKARIPPIKLTNNSIQIFNPIPIGSPFLTLLPKIIVIGRHHARGMINQPCATQPIIEKINAAVAKPLYSWFDSIEQPHPVHTTASSCISLPHLLQNFIESS